MQPRVSILKSAFKLGKPFFDLSMQARLRLRPLSTPSPAPPPSSIWLVIIIVGCCCCC